MVWETIGPMLARYQHRIRHAAAVLILLAAVALPSGAARPLSPPSLPPIISSEELTPAGIVGEDDRRLAQFPYVVNIGAGPNSLGSGVVIGRRHLITAAHLFVSHGKWYATRSDRHPQGYEYRAYHVFIEGCPSRIYGIVNVFVNTTDPETYRRLDYAVVQLDQPTCGVAAPIWSMTSDEVDRILYGHGGEPAHDVTAVGYYGPGSVAHYSESAVLETGNFANLPYDMVLAWQYAAEGKVVDEDNSSLFRESPPFTQPVWTHRIDAAIGGSGGPLLIHDGEKNYVIAIHIGERRDNDAVNFAIPISDSFLDLIERRVPDADIRRDSS